MAKKRYSGDDLFSQIDSIIPQTENKGDISSSTKESITSITPQGEKIDTPSTPPTENQNSSTKKRGRPKTAPESVKKYISLRKDLNDYLVSLSEATGLSVTWLLNQAIDRTMNNAPSDWYYINK